MVFIKHYHGNKAVPDSIKNAKDPFRTLLYNYWFRCHKTKNNAVTSVTGMTGSGKSFLCLYLAYKLDSKFTIDNVIFDPSILAEKLSNPKRIGENFIYEEAEVSLSSKSHWSEINKIIAKLFSTVRFKRSMIWLNLPSETQLDSDLRRLRYANIKTHGIAQDTRGSYSKFSFEFLTPPLVADSTSKAAKNMRRDYLVYFKKLETGQIIKQVLTSFKFRIPKDPKFKLLLSQYEEKKAKFLADLYKQFKAQLITELKSKNVVDLKVVVDAIYNDKKKFYVGGRYSEIEIMSAFDLNKTNTKEVIKELKAKEKEADIQIKKEKTGKVLPYSKFIEQLIKGR
jgi:hypothetical protein